MNIARNGVFIIGSFIAAFLVFSLFPRLEFTYVEIAGVKLGLYDRLNNTARLVGEQDAGATGAPGEAARLIDTKENSFWVYLGETKRKSQTQWLLNNFGLSRVPQKDELITARTDLFKRFSEPIFDGQHWSRGVIIGLLQKDQGVIVHSTINIDGIGDKSLWWARVELRH